MTTRTTIGNNFDGAVDYQYFGRRNAPSDKQSLILFAEGVRTDGVEVMRDDFGWGCSLNPSLSKPVWHTVISFNPDDTAKLTNEKMLAVAQDYRKEMGLLDTQCVIFRHFDQEDNQHLHILVNRVANDGHSIPDGRNFYRSKLAVEKLVPAHGLTPAAGQRPELQHPERIVGAYDKAGAEIRQALAYSLQTVTERGQLWQELRQGGITAQESSRGVTFTKDGYTFKGSQIARDYSLGGIDKQLAANQAAQAQRAAQQQADAREHEQIRQQAQRVLTGLVDQKAFASHAEFTGQVAAQGYVFVTNPAGEKLRHAVSERQFDLVDVQPGGPTDRPLQEQVAAVVQYRAAEAQAQQAARREEARRETERTLTQTRDSGLSYSEQFFYRLRAQPYELLRDPQTQQLTHVRHQDSKELFTWAQVQPGGAGAPALAEQLAAAVRLEQEQVTTRQQLAAASSWAQGRELVESVTTQVRQEQHFLTRAQLQSCLKAEGVTLLPPAAPGGAELFRLDATGQFFREKEVLRGSSLAQVLAEAEVRRVTRRQAVQEQTKQDVAQTLYAPETPLTSLPAYWHQLEEKGYRFRQAPGEAMEIEHRTSGERFQLPDVQPGGPAASPLADRVRAVLAQQQQTTTDLEQVLAAKNFLAWSQFEAQVQRQGYQFVMGLDGVARLLHEASRQHVALDELRPHGRDLTTQVYEVIAARQAELVQGRIEVLPTPERSASQRAVGMQRELVAAGAQVEVAPQPATGSVVLTYTHVIKGAQLGEVSAWLATIQQSKGTTVREQDQGFNQPAAEWPARRGEYAQATLVFADQAAYQRAAAHGVSVTATLQQAGAVVRQVPGDSTESIVLEVDYHTQRSEVKTLTKLLDQWQGEGLDIKVRETERAREMRGGQAPEAAQTYEHTR